MSTNWSVGAVIVHVLSHLVGVSLTKLCRTVKYVKHTPCDAALKRRDPHPGPGSTRVDEAAVHAEQGGALLGGEPRVRPDRLLGTAPARRLPRPGRPAPLGEQLLGRQLQRRRDRVQHL